MAASSVDTPSYEAELDDEQPERVQGTDLGRYRLVYQIASGGMATVFLGRATGPGGFERPVALKRIHPHLARRRHFVEMFLDEARIASRVVHPNVCTVLDFGEADGTYFIAMEYLVGVPLTALIRAVSGRSELLSSSRWRALACRIVADAAQGLHAAHELKDDRGEPLHIVHRDVSPSNLFVTFDGAVKVVDFGVALARNRLHQTTTGTLKGKLAYMAPEHAGGAEVDRRADVWALGVCAWEALTGHRLFRRKNEMDVLLAVQSGPVPPPSSVVPSVPPELDRIVLRALTRDREDRHPTARALAQDLEAFVRASGEPTGLAELSELMTPLLRREKTQRHELVATALRGAGSLDAADTASLPAADERSDTASLDAPAAGDEMSGVRDTRVSPPPTQALVTPASSRPRRLGWLAGLVLAAAAGGLAIGALSGRDDPGDEVATPSSSPPAHHPSGEVHAPPAHAAAAEEGEPPSRTKVQAATEVPAEAEEAAETAEADETGQPPEPETAEPGRQAGASHGDGPSTEGAAAEPEATTRSGARRHRDRPRARRRASAPAATGTVNVVGIGGWADVYAGSRRLGRTPLSAELPAGRHVLSARPFGEAREKRLPVVVEPGEVVRLRVRMR